MGCASDKTLALADRSVAGSGGDPNRGSFHPAFADESIDRMCDRSSDGGLGFKPRRHDREQARSHMEMRSPVGASLLAMASEHAQQEEM